MTYVILFVAGAAASAGALVIWYVRYIAQLRKERRSLEDWRAGLESYSSGLSRQAADLENRKRDLDQAVATFEARKVQYDVLVVENNSLKQDLFNLSVQLKKMERDHAAITRRQEEINGKADDLAGRYLDENVSWIGGKVTPKNFTTCKNRLVKVVSRCRDIGFDIPERKEEELVQDLRKKFEQAVRTEYQRQEQARIPATRMSCSSGGRLCFG